MQKTNSYKKYKRNSPHKHIHEILIDISLYYIIYVLTFKKSASLFARIQKAKQMLFFCSVCSILIVNWLGFCHGGGRI